MWQQLPFADMIQLRPPQKQIKLLRTNERFLKLLLYVKLVSNSHRVWGFHARNKKIE